VQEVIAVPVVSAIRVAYAWQTSRTRGSSLVVLSISSLPPECERRRLVTAVETPYTSERST